MKVFIFFALLAFALTTVSFNVEETKEEINLTGKSSSTIIERALECIRALGGTKDCIEAVREAIEEHDKDAAKRALLKCAKIAKDIFDKCWTKVRQAI